MFNALCCVLAVSASPIALQTKPDSSPKEAPLVTLQKEADRLITSGETPGLVFVIRRGGKEVFRFAGGYANLEHKAKMSFDSVHEMASVSKQFTAVTAMALIEKNMLKLDSKLSDYVEAAPESWKDITVKHLLNHTSGLPDYLVPTLSLRTDKSTTELLNGLKSRPLEFKPGSQFEYSNSGYMALGHILTQAGKKPFFDSATELLLRPAGMATAVVASPDALIPNRAQGYVKNKEGFLNETYVSRPLSQLGDGWLMASANDLLRWHEALRDGKILRKESWKQVFQPVDVPSKEGNAVPYGFGFIVERAGEKPRVSHSGGWIGTMTFFVSDTQNDDCIVALLNTSECDIRPLMAATRAVMDAK